MYKGRSESRDGPRRGGAGGGGNSGDQSKLRIYRDDSSVTKLCDLHVYKVPADLWRESLNNILNNVVTETVSVGIIRVPVEIRLTDVREELVQQLALDDRDYVFLRSVGRSLTRLRTKQEYQLKAKHFLPPVAYAPELYILEATPDIREAMAMSERLSQSPPLSRRTSPNHTYRGYPHPYRNGYHGDSDTDRTYRSASQTNKYPPLPRIGSDADVRPLHEGPPSRNPASPDQHLSYYTNLQDDRRAASGNQRSNQAHNDPHNRQQQYNKNDPHYTGNQYNNNSSNNPNTNYNDRNYDNSSNNKNRPDNTTNDPHQQRKNMSYNDDDIANEAFGRPPPAPLQDIIEGHGPQRRDDPEISRDGAQTFRAGNPDARIDPRSDPRSDPRDPHYDPRYDPRDPRYDPHSDPHHRDSRDPRDPRDPRPDHRSDPNAPRQGGFSPSRSKHSPSRSPDKARDRRHDDDSGVAGLTPEDEYGRDQRDGRRNRDDYNSSPGKTRDHHQRRLDGESFPLDDDSDAERRRRLDDDDPRNDLDRRRWEADQEERRRQAEIDRRKQEEEEERRKREEQERKEEEERRRKEREDEQRRKEEEDARRRKEEEDARRRKEEEEEDRRRRQEEEDRLEEEDKQWEIDEDDNRLDSHTFRSSSPNPERDTESRRAKRVVEKNQLLKDIDDARQSRQDLEREREELVKKAKSMQHKTTNRRNEARDMWKKKYFEEKKKTAPLEESSTRLREELEALHKRLMNTLESPKDKNVKVSENKPSVKSNYIIRCTKLQHEIEDLQRRVENARMKLGAEMKLRTQAQTEMKAVRSEAMQNRLIMRTTAHGQQRTGPPGGVVGTAK